VHFLQNAGLGQARLLQIYKPASEIMDAALL
jgi:hypothetical protein